MRRRKRRGRPRRTGRRCRRSCREGRRRAAGRVPFTTRLRSDLAQALKRALLERQSEGVQPNTVQDIFEEAAEPWLRSQGYLSRTTD